jgi:MFS family permease
MFRDKTFVGVNLAVFLMMIGVGMIVAILPQKVMTLTGSGATVGYLASAFALSYIALQVPIGHFADQLGFKVFLVMGYVLCCVTGILFYYASSANLIFVGRLLQGVGKRRYGH